MNTTIVAPATAMVEQPIGIIRISGPKASRIAGKLIGKTEMTPRQVYVSGISTQHFVDQAVVIFFQAPYSFTGEDVVELQMHGNPHLINRVVFECIKLGAVMANPGEFSQRAYLNGKLSLVQVEAVADLIHAKSEKAALSASKSMSGAFCKVIRQLQSDMMALRVEVEATIDFDEDDIPTLGLDVLHKKLAILIQEISTNLSVAKSGVLLAKCPEVVLVGKPNVGKSTLMNELCGSSVSIITEHAGTTRDLITRDIICNGVALRLTDTAGLRAAYDPAEQEGIERAKKVLTDADLVLHLSTEDELLPIQTNVPVWRVRTKIDLGDIQSQGADFSISVKTGAGISALKSALSGFVEGAQSQEVPFSARQRHIDALERVHEVLVALSDQVEHLDMLADALAQSHHYLGQIIGETTPDDVLGEIFSQFCIGK